MNRSIPSHIFIAVWNSADSRWRLKPGDGTTESHEGMWLIVAALYLAVKRTQRVLKTDYYQLGEVNGSGETKLLKQPNDWRE